MIITRMYGGLGNQMFQYAFAKNISLKTDQPLLVDSRFVLLSNRSNDISKFKIQARECIKDELLDINYFYTGSNTKILRLYDQIFLFFPNRYLKKEKFLYEYNPLLKTKKSEYLVGYWQNPQYFSNIREELMKEFVPKIYQSNFIKNRFNSVAVHIRRGDYINSPELCICDDHYYLKGISIIKSKISNPYFYFFSDDTQYALNFIKKHHINGEVQNGDSIRDFESIKRCRHKIISNSTYSWWGAWLGEQNIIICPQKWSKGNNIIKNDLLQKNWIKI